MEEQKVVAFRIESEIYGLPIQNVEQILTDQKPTRIPRTHKAILGIFELRGRTLPIVDLGMLFEFEDQTAEEHNVIVVQSETGNFALRVGRVEGIHAITDEQVQPAPTLGEDRFEDFLQGVLQVDEALISLIDLDRLVDRRLQSSLIKVAA